MELLSDLLLCGVCNIRYDIVDRTPIILCTKCCHTVCKSCAIEYTNTCKCQLEYIFDHIHTDEKVHQGFIALVKAFDKKPVETSESDASLCDECNNALAAVSCDICHAKFCSECSQMIHQDKYRK